MTNFGPPTPLTSDDLIALIRRNFEQHWIGGLLQDPTALSIINGWIAIILRLQEMSDENVDIGGYILTAPGANHSISTVQIQRPSGSDVTFQTNQRFADQRGAVWFVAIPTPAPASGVPQTITLPLVSQRNGYWLNTFEPPSFQFLDPSPDPNFIVLPGTDPGTEGTAPFLDLHGGERRVLRAPGEDDPTYATRMLQIPDQVSPQAIALGILQVLDGFLATHPFAEFIDRYGLRSLFEPFEDWAQPAQEDLAGAGGFFCDSLCFVDDPHGPRIRDIRTAIASLEVHLPTVIDPNDPRFFADFSFADDPLLGYPDLPPGTAIAAPIAALADLLDTKRAAGVLVRIIFGETQLFLNHPKTMAAFGSWTAAGLSAPPDMVTAIAQYDGDDAYVTSVTGAGGGVPIVPGLGGDTLFTSEALPSAPISVDFVVLRAWAKRIAAGGVTPQLAFTISPAGAPSTIRVLAVSGAPYSVTQTDWTQFTCIMERNPVSGVAWTPADVSGAGLTFNFGVANVAAVGATDELRVSELFLELHVSYG